MAGEFVGGAFLSAAIGIGLTALSDKIREALSDPLPHRANTFEMYMKELQPNVELIKSLLAALPYKEGDSSVLGTVEADQHVTTLFGKISATTKDSLHNIMGYKEFVENNPPRKVIANAVKEAVTPSSQKKLTPKEAEKWLATNLDGAQRYIQSLMVLVNIALQLGVHQKHGTFVKPTYDKISCVQDSLWCLSRPDGYFMLMRDKLQSVYKTLEGEGNLVRCVHRIHTELVGDGTDQGASDGPQGGVGAPFSTPTAVQNPLPLDTYSRPTTGQVRDDQVSPAQVNVGTHTSTSAPDDFETDHWSSEHGSGDYALGSSGANSEPNLPTDIPARVLFATQSRAQDPSSRTPDGACDEEISRLKCCNSARTPSFDRARGLC